MLVPFSTSLHAGHLPWMRRACEVAVLSAGNTAPNPLVGAVLVTNDQMIGEGRHLRYGAPHAEVEAIRACTQPALLADSTLYVNLEPCNHHGKTPPCTDLILQSGIRKVVVGTTDPHERVAGRGIARLTEAGVTVILGALAEECRWLNRRFFTYHTHGRPYVVLKWAESADGFVSPGEPGPYWLSCAQSRQLVHRWRTEEAAVLVGAGTALADNPHLGARLYAGPQPRRVLVERAPPIDSSLLMLRDEGTCLRLVTDTEKPLAEQILPLLQRLHREQILSVMVEAGPRLQQAFLDSGLWDEIRLFATPGMLGLGLPAAKLPPTARLYECHPIEDDQLLIYRNNG